MLVMLDGKKMPYDAVLLCDYKDYSLVRVDEPVVEHTNQEEPEDGWSGVYAVGNNGDVIGSVEIVEERLGDGTWDIKYNIHIPKIEEDYLSNTSVVTYNWIEE